MFELAQYVVDKDFWPLSGLGVLGVSILLMIAAAFNSFTIENFQLPVLSIGIYRSP